MVDGIYLGYRRGFARFEVSRAKDVGTSTDHLSPRVSLHLTEHFALLPPYQVGLNLFLVSPIGSSLVYLLGFSLSLQNI